MKKAIAILCVSLAALMLFAACQAQPASAPAASALPPERVEELHALSVQFTDYLNTGDIDAAMGTTDETMTTAMDGPLAPIWTQIAGFAGASV